MTPLLAALDTLLPGGEGFPPALTLGLDAWLTERTALLEPAQAALDALPAEFADLDRTGRESALSALESAKPIVFGLLLRAAYSAYYVHPLVLARLAEATGYSTRPPQPDGYVLPPFDPAILAVPAARAPHWRRV